MPTRGLVALLEDAVLTTVDPKMELPHLDAVLLHTDHGPWQVPVDKDETDGDALFEEVTTDLLVASSTSRSVVSQCHTMCTGRLHKPILVSRLDAEALIDVFKPLVSKRLPRTVTHEVVITYTGETVIVAEDPKLVGDGMSVTLTALGLDDFPRNIAEMLQVEPKTVVIDGKEIAPTFATGLSSHQLDVLVKVSKRRKMPIAQYRYHQRQRVRFDIGSAYSVVVVPLPLKDDGTDVEPQVEVFTPELPQRPAVTQTQPLTPA